MVVHDRIAIRVRTRCGAHVEVIDVEHVADPRNFPVVLAEGDTLAINPDGGGTRIEIVYERYEH